jgi:hypothetical protein
LWLIGDHYIYNYIFLYNYIYIYYIVYIYMYRYIYIHLGNYWWPLSDVTCLTVNV